MEGKVGERGGVGKGWVGGREGRRNKAGEVGGERGRTRDEDGRDGKPYFFTVEDHQASVVGGTEGEDLLERSGHRRFHFGSHWI